jgi:hypothetical protein
MPIRLPVSRQPVEFPPAEIAEGHPRGTQLHGRPALLEAGQRNPSVDTLAKLALALAVDIAELVPGLQNLLGRT